MTCSVMHDGSWTAEKMITCHGNNTHKQGQIKQKIHFVSLVDKWNIG